VPELDAVSTTRYREVVLTRSKFGCGSVPLWVVQERFVHKIDIGFELAYKAREGLRESDELKKVTADLSFPFLFACCCETANDDAPSDDSHSRRTSV